LNYITERSKKILFKIASEGKCTIRDIKNSIGVSERTIYSDLKEIEKFLENYDITLIKKPRVGVWIEGDEKVILNMSMDIIKEKIDHDGVYRDYKHCILFELFNTNDYITINDLADKIFASRSVVENKLAEIKKFLEKNNLVLEKKPSRGIRVVGDEKSIRFAIVELFKSDNNNLIVEYGNKNEADIINNNLRNDIKDVFISIDVNAVIEMVDEIAKLDEVCFTDVSYNSLVINLIVTIERIKLGKFIYFDLNTINKLKTEREYNLANIIVNMISNRFNISFIEEEVCYITILLLSSRIQKKVLDVNKRINSSFDNVVSLCDRGIKEAEKVVNIKFEDDPFLRQELYIHIKAMINRILYGINIENPFTVKIKTEYCISFEAALVFKNLIYQEYGLRLSIDEIAYIALHFQVSIEKFKRESKKIRVAIVCSVGLGNLSLIAMQINRLIPDLEITHKLSVIDLIDRKLDADFIISTVPIFKSSIPVLQIEPFISSQDIIKIRQMMEKTKVNTVLIQKKNFFKSLINKSWIFPKVKGLNQEEILKMLTNKLTDKNVVNEKFLNSLLVREKLESTAFSNVAMPHGDPDHVKKTAIVICTLDKEILWGDRYVDIIFLIALSKDNYKNLQTIFEYFYYLIEDRELISKLKNATTSNEIYKIIMN